MKYIFKNNILYTPYLFRWMQETKEIVDQLQNRITELKIENKDLRLAHTIRQKGTRV